jgi:hypothetical protein
MRQNFFVRYGLMTAFFGIGAAISPMVFDAIRAGTVPGWFEAVTFVLGTILVFSALRFDDVIWRKRIVTWVLRLFAISTMLVLGFTPLGIAFAVVGFAYGSIEWPHRRSLEVAAY